LEFNNFSVSEAIFDTKWQAFNEKYGGIAMKLLEYVTKVWIPLKTIISFWADQYIHFGSITMSRVEGNHSVLKKFETLKQQLVYVDSKDGPYVIQSSDRHCGFSRKGDVKNRRSSF
jgi:hypothetical protein